MPPSTSLRPVVVSGPFDDLRYENVRFLDRAAEEGPLHVLLWSDELVRAMAGHDPKFSCKERRYFLQALRRVGGVTLVSSLPNPDALPKAEGMEPRAWVVAETDDTPRKRAFCQSLGIDYRVVRDVALDGVPPDTDAHADSAGHHAQKVLVTGCYDWLHTGHVRFFEEASAYGDLCVAVGHDANIRRLKGEGHPIFPQAIRRYLVAAVRYVSRAVVTSGHGWLDAAPEIATFRPDIYLVNQDGDREEKRRFCRQHGIEYVVLERTPRPGLPARSSTSLRGV